MEHREVSAESGPVGEQLRTPPQRRFQFTIRVYFVAALLVALVSGAMSVAGRLRRITALALVGWFLAAGVWRLLGARRQTLALAAGSALCLLVWLPACLLPRWVLSGDPRGMIYAACTWGIVLSLVLALSDSVEWLLRRREGAPVVLPVASLPARLALGRCVLAWGAVPLALMSDRAAPWIAAALFYLDLPLAPYRDRPAFWIDRRALAAAALLDLVFGVLLYAAAGRLLRKGLSQPYA